MDEKKGAVFKFEMEYTVSVADLASALLKFQEACGPSGTFHTLSDYKGMDAKQAIGVRSLPLNNPIVPMDDGRGSRMNMQQGMPALQVQSAPLQPHIAMRRNNAVPPQPHMQQQQPLSSMSAAAVVPAANIAVPALQPGLQQAQPQPQPPVQVPLATYKEKESNQKVTWDSCVTYLQRNRHEDYKNATTWTNEAGSGFWTTDIESVEKFLSITPKRLPSRRYGRKLGRERHGQALVENVNLKRENEIGNEDGNKQTEENAPSPQDHGGSEQRERPDPTTSPELPSTGAAA